MPDDMQCHPLYTEGVRQTHSIDLEVLIKLVNKTSDFV